MRGHVQQRGPRTWRLKVYVGRSSADGRKHYVERTVDGSKREAERELARLVVEVDEGRHLATGPITFGELLDRWLEVKRLSVEPTTLRSYQWVAATYLRPALAHRKVAGIGAMELDALYVNLFARPLSARTVRICHTVVRQSLEQARKWGLVARNPALDATPPGQVRREVTPPSPEEVRTLLVGFETTDQAGAATSAIIAAGIVPAAIEMMDALAIEAAEKAVACGYPKGAVAVLVIELDGPEVEVEAQFAQVEQIAKAHHAFETRIAANPAERALMWKGRKSAFAAVGRISPSYFVQDGVIPRTKLPEVLSEMTTMADAVGLRVANVFHAGDGNLHPLVLFDDAVEGQAHDAEELAGSILELCIASGGSITGEHGVGQEKRLKMGKQFTPEDLDTMQLVRCAFDPDGIANPGKIFPTPRLCGERPGPRKGEHEVQAAGLGEVF